jgi:hypothetical protein
MDSKDDPVSSHIPEVLTLNQRPRLPTKVPFKGGSPPRYPKPIFVSSLSESRG